MMSISSRVPTTPDQPSVPVIALFSTQEHDGIEGFVLARATRVCSESNSLTLFGLESD